VNYSRQAGIFTPPLKPIHIVGCGATGSHVALELAKAGCSLVLWDFDIIESHNLPNQMFLPSQIGMNKAEALKEVVEMFNPLISVEVHAHACESSDLREVDGFIFLLVDSFKARHQLAKGLLFSKRNNWVIETRMGVRELSCICFQPKNPIHWKQWVASLGLDESTQREASACGTPITIGATAGIAARIAVWKFFDLLDSMGVAGKTDITLSLRQQSLFPGLSPQSLTETLWD
jgi:molybdopterin/thiamine biosynthesis adenylyltransferase